MKENRVLSYLNIVGVAFLLACNYQLFIFKNAFAPAGLSGIATMVQYKLNFSIGYINLLINLPLCVLAYFKMNRSFAFKNLTFCLSFTGFILFFKQFPLLDAYAYVTENGTSTLLAPVAAGVVSGFVYGVAVREGATTGGTDIVAALIRQKDPARSLFSVIFAINTVVAVVSFFVYDYRFEPVILCIVYCFLSSRIGDAIIRGGKSQIKFEIITRQYEEMSTEIIQKLRHSVTMLPAKGMFSGNDTELLICLVNRHQVPALREIIARYPGSFAYVAPVSEVYGNFKQIAHIVSTKK